MEIKKKHAFQAIFRRSRLGVPLVVWILWIFVSMVYYWWLVSKIRILETENRVFKKQIASLKPYQIPEVSDTSSSLCETIHLFIVCIGKCTRQISPMLKSLLHHRQNPLHFHIIVDYTSEQTFNKLFETWSLPDVTYTCYQAHGSIEKVHWIPNSHYSGIFTLLKLLSPDLLPASLSKVIVLDSDLTFLCDIAELWNMFRNMTGNQFLGLVENESDWYYSPGRWPALGRGYNTGVMLMDLKKMRSISNWSLLWHQAVNENIPTLERTALGDQDVINAIIKKYPSVIYNISCQYNLQMSTKSLAKFCYGENRSNVKIIHWNSPKKQNISIVDADYFRNIHISYVNLDGNLLKQQLHRCKTPEVITPKSNQTDLCQSFRAAQRIKLRTHVYYMDYTHDSTDRFDVTLVLQLSIDRLQFLERLVRYWEGPLSAAIYLADCDVVKLERFVRDSSDILSLRRNIGYHLVFKHDAVHYPVNYLRNVALDNVDTEYVFLMDVDFVPMTGLYDHLRMAARVVDPYPQKKVLVVPAFETQGYRSSPPRTKEALLARLERHTRVGRKRVADVAPFRAHEWPRGHRATNYTRWANAEWPYEVEWESDYEPYLMVHRSVPRYDTRFSGFGWNKVSHMVQLRALGYKPVVLPGAFVVHTTHAPSPDITEFRANVRYRICLALLKQEFLDDLKRKHNFTFDVPSEPDSSFLVQAKKLVLDQGKDPEQETRRKQVV